MLLKNIILKNFLQRLATRRANRIAKSLDPLNKFADSRKPNFVIELTTCERRLAFSAVPLVDMLDHLHQICEADNGGHVEAMPLDSLSGLLQTHDVDAHDAFGPVESIQPFSSSADQWTGLNDAKSIFGLTGRGQTVAVIDSGIAWDHVALGNGFGAGHRVVGGWDFAESDSNPYDDAPAGFHGTAVAGVIGGSGPSNAGVATGVDLVALRVFDDYGRGNIQLVESALRWVHDHRNDFENPISVVNLSLGIDSNGSSPPAGSILEDEFQLLRDDGITVVVSAGNAFQKYNSPGLAYPASSPLVIPVASVDADGHLSDFSQRNDAVIAAPGRQITSTVPDHLYGADGHVDDYSTVSGTSFSSPYVAGATALLRQAMQITGVDNITVDAIKHALFTTADSVFDSLTNANYSRLNVLHALQSILPSDTVGNTLDTAAIIDAAAGNGSLQGFINTLGDADVYRWTAATNGSLTIDYHAENLPDSVWTLWQNSQSSALHGSGTITLNVVAGQTLALGLSDTAQIGNFDFDWRFQAAAPPAAAQPQMPSGAPIELGHAAFGQSNVQSSGYYSVKATNQGVLSFQVNDATASGSLSIFDTAGRLLQADTTLEDGVFRVDLNANVGQEFRVWAKLGSGAATGQLQYANIVNVINQTLNLNGSDQVDQWKVSLENGIDVQVGNINYHWSTDQVNQVKVHQGGGSDSLDIRGSASTEVVYLRSDNGLLTANRLGGTLKMNWDETETVSYHGGGGSDRVYAFDTNGDDELTIRPKSFELQGTGYKFSVDDVNRIYVDASNGGNDRAYLFDSSGDDRLSIRPQFSSLSGDGYFNYVTGFERVYAYATAGGIDTATLYDSSGNDTFSTSGDIASIVGNNYFSYTRYFEKVEAISSSGGRDIAALYSPSDATHYVGADFVTFNQAALSRTARGFGTIQTTWLAARTASVTEVDSLDYSSVVLQTQGYFQTPQVEVSFAAAKHSEVASIDAVDLQPQLSSDWFRVATEESNPLKLDDAVTISLLDSELEQQSLEEIFSELGR